MTEKSEYGKTEKELIEEKGKEWFKEFCEWMRGQTLALIDGEEVFYHWDIEKFTEKRCN